MRENRDNCRHWNQKTIGKRTIGNQKRSSSGGDKNIDAVLQRNVPVTATGTFIHQYWTLNSIQRLCNEFQTQRKKIKLNYKYIVPPNPMTHKLKVGI